MTKINQLIIEWPKGTVMTLDHLKQKGINRESIKRYRKSGWIDAVGVLEMLHHVPDKQGFSVDFIGVSCGILQSFGHFWDRFILFLDEGRLISWNPDKLGIHLLQRNTKFET